MKLNITNTHISCEINYEVFKASGPGAAKAPHILLLHGHSSSMAEFSDLLPLLRERANIYLLDFPSCGGSSDVDVAQVAFEYPRYSSLSYLADAIAGFVLKAVRPQLRQSGQAKLTVAGGSLGGNMALWLACATKRYSWLDEVVVWSPGSAWKGDFYQVFGGPVALKRSSEDWTGRRIEFLTSSYVAPAAPTVPPQPEFWYSDAWGGGELAFRPELRCESPPFGGANGAYPLMTRTKAAAIERALQHANGRFTPKAAQWHWRVAADQLLFSHRTTVDKGVGSKEQSAPRIAALKVPTHFMAGEMDNHAPANLHRYTHELYEDAKASAKVPVTWRSVANSGHSIHNERPDFLANILLGVRT